MQNYEQPIITVLIFEDADVLATVSSPNDDLGGIPDGWGGVN